MRSHLRDDGGEESVAWHMQPVQTIAQRKLSNKIEKKNKQFILQIVQKIPRYNVKILDFVIFIDDT